MHPARPSVLQSDKEHAADVIHSAGCADVETSETDVSTWKRPEERSVFACRYRIESQESTCMQSGLIGRDLFTGLPACLRFYSPGSSRLENAVRMHDILKDSQYISRLIERIPGKEGTPDCLVFEAGSFTLAQKLDGESKMAPIERRAMVHSILEALRDLHDRNVVHGNLDPSSIVWSTTDFCWKFLDLEFSVEVGDLIPVHQRGATRYLAPEIQQALGQGTHSLQADVSMDMWSFGLIAFEIFTGTCVLDSALVRSYVSEECSRLRQELQNDAAADPSSSGNLSSLAAQRAAEFEFVSRLIAVRASSRLPALQACESKIFGIVKDPYEGVHPLVGVRCYPEEVRSISAHMPDWILRHIAMSHLDLSVIVERISQEGNPETAFHQRASVMPMRFLDNYLPDHPVHVLPTGESFRLRITITRDRDLRIPFEEVVSVELQPPDCEAKALDIFQRIDGNEMVALALLDPTSFSSRRLNTKSPGFGLVDTKYVRLLVHTKLRLGDNFPGDLDAYSRIYLQLNHPPGRFSLFRSWFRRYQIRSGARLHKAAPGKQFPK